jgi:ribosomal protein S1
MKIKKDQTVEGEITRIVEEAIFVDIGTTHQAVIPKVDIDQLEKDPSIELQVGKTVPVHIYYAPQNGGNPLGSIAHALGIPYHSAHHGNKNSDPWAKIEEKYQVGDVVLGTVKNVKKYGAFVQLPAGVSGLVHVSQMQPGFTTSPWEVVNVGEKVRVQIIGIEPSRKRNSLSLSDVN